jgi:cellulose synthase/poly-beta-1,6-N-acetylglucosamine synthase-like glycosyltransferase
MNLLDVVLVAFSLLITIQAAYTVYLMLYTWNQETNYAASRAPKRFRAPQRTFTVLLPARHEERVIARTVDRVVRSNYPKEMLEAIVICEEHDLGTIEEAQRAAGSLAAAGLTNVRIVTFNDKPINKPHALNVGLTYARHDVVTIVDAEDEIHPDLLQMVNTVMVEEQVKVVQSGVQLMNFDSTWWSAHNVLEYYYWFKSRLHVYTRQGMTPLGGNTVFFDTAVLRSVQGWDEHNLTEDADIGIRLSARGERVRVVYDDAYVTKEETPPDLKGFIKQRTRWNQGFLQTLRKGEWLGVPQPANRLRALYILAFPFVQGILSFYVPISLMMMLLVKVPMLVTLLLFLPGYLLIAYWLLAVVGLYSFAQAHALRPRHSVALHLLVTFFPYMWVLGFASLRAIWRETRGLNNWEKTVHVGAHRHPRLAGQVEVPADLPLAPRTQAAQH